jgi:hypothetical protein
LNLKPCPYRLVDDEGHILCDKIKSGDRQVTPDVCRICPVAAISCVHLRAALEHQARPPLTVRYANGKTEVWDDRAPTIALQRAACSVKVTPVHSPRDCAGCPIRQPLTLVGENGTSVVQTAAAKGGRRRSDSPRPAPAAVPPAGPEAVTAVAKVILLQDWLARRNRQSGRVEAAQDSSAGARPARVLAEEKRTGWTD